MPTTNAVASEPEVIEAANAPTGASGAPPIELDEFGRDSAERTVELTPSQAEAINQEVVSGKHKTYDDALQYVVSRGLAEIKRQRDAAMAVAAKTLLKNKVDSWKTLVTSNPALITNAEFVKTMMKDLGLTPPQAK